MFLQILVCIVLAVACVYIGKWLGKKLFGAKKESSQIKRDAQSLAIVLRAHGLTRLPTILEEYVVGDFDDLLQSIKEMALVLKAGNESIVKELDGTFNQMLAAKLATPEGRAVVAAKLAEAVKLAAPVVAAL